jgi:hypothetical protein
MVNLILDFGRLDADWLSDVVPSPSDYSQAPGDGGSGIIEIYYLTPTTSGSTGGSTGGSITNVYPTIKLLRG